MLFDSALQQFLLVYCAEAVKAVTGKDDKALDGTDTVFVFFGAVIGERQRLPLDGPMPTARELLTSLKSNRDETTPLLMGPPTATLSAFAGKEESRFFAEAPSDSDLEGFELVDDPPATRLHPHGPHAEAGQRMALAYLTKKIAELSAAAN